MLHRESLARFFFLDLVRVAEAVIVDVIVVVVVCIGVVGIVAVAVLIADADVVCSFVDVMAPLKNLGLPAASILVHCWAFGFFPNYYFYSMSLAD